MNDYTMLGDLLGWYNAENVSGVQDSLVHDFMLILSGRRLPSHAPTLFPLFVILRSEATRSSISMVSCRGLSQESLGPMPMLFISLSQPHPGVNEGFAKEDIYNGRREKMK